MIYGIAPRECSAQVALERICLLLITDCCRCHILKIVHVFDIRVQYACGGHLSFAKVLFIFLRHNMKKNIETKNS